MLTTDFYEIFKSSAIEKYFDGVYPSDLIPRTLKVNHFIICNIDDSNNIGSHWYIVYRHTIKIIECFDSLGVNPEKRQFLAKKFNIGSVTKIKCNVTPVQSQDSENCGLFCLYFIHNRLFNKDLGYSELLNEIFYSPNDNDAMVKDFCKEYYNSNQ